MFIIIDITDSEHLEVVTEDRVGFEGCLTMYFPSWEAANEYAERYLGDVQIVEIEG